MNNLNTLRLPFQEAFERFTVSPFTNWERFFNPQFAVSYNFQDVGVENHVLRRVGSYGNQLGHILKALDVLVSRLPKDDLLPQERIALDQLQTLSSDAKSAVAEFKGGRKNSITESDIDFVTNGLQSLARSRPDLHRKLVERLQKGMAEPQSHPRSLKKRSKK